MRGREIYGKSISILLSLGERKKDDEMMKWWVLCGTRFYVYLSWCIDVPIGKGMMGRRWIGVLDQTSFSE